MYSTPPASPCGPAARPVPGMDRGPGRRGAGTEKNWSSEGDCLAGVPRADDWRPERGGLRVASPDSEPLRSAATRRDNYPARRPVICGFNRAAGIGGHFCCDADHSRNPTGIRGAQIDCGSTGTSAILAIPAGDGF